MDHMEIPLKYEGEIVGDARLTADEDGIHVQGRIFDKEHAQRMLGAHNNHGASFGFEEDGTVSFSAILPDEDKIAHLKKDSPLRYGKDFGNE